MHLVDTTNTDGGEEQGKEENYDKVANSTIEPECHIGILIISLYKKFKN